MRLAVVLVGLLVIPFSVRATLYNASADFSAVNNSRSVWRYGTIGDANAVVRAFEEYNSFSTYLGLEYWYGATGLIVHNGTGAPISSNTVTWPAATLSLVNLAASHASVVRFIAPVAGTYEISGSFFVLSSIGQSDVGIAANYDTLFTIDNRSVALFGINSLTGTASFSTSTYLRENDTVDFAVGGRFIDERDYTGLGASVRLASPVPEPKEYVMLVLGIGMIGWQVKARQEIKRGSLSAVHVQLHKTLTRTGSRFQDARPTLLNSLTLNCSAVYGN